MMSLLLNYDCAALFLLQNFHCPVSSQYLVTSNQIQSGAGSPHSKVRLYLTKDGNKLKISTNLTPFWIDADKKRATGWQCIQLKIFLEEKVAGKHMVCYYRIFAN